jgi:hypothetical protein
MKSVHSISSVCIQFCEFHTFYQKVKILSCKVHEDVTYMQYDLCTHMYISVASWYEVPSQLAARLDQL